MKEYRTEEQFISIMKCAENARYTEAAAECEKYGFYAQDLIKHYHNTKDKYNWDWEMMVYIAQDAQKLRKW